MKIQTVPCRHVVGAKPCRSVSRLSPAPPSLMPWQTRQLGSRPPKIGTRPPLPSGTLQRRRLARYRNCIVAPSGNGFPRPGRCWLPLPDADGTDAVFPNQRTETMTQPSGDRPRGRRMVSLLHVGLVELQHHGPS